MSIVSDLLKTKFTERDLAAQRDIVRSGPPRPELPDLLLPSTVGTTSFERRFDVALYSRFPWLAGCATRSKLFCWSCLLFGQQTETTQAWSRHGIDNLKELVNLAYEHSKSKAHSRSGILLKRFEYREIYSDDEVKDSSVEVLRKHNKTVDEHRNILACYSGTLALLAYQNSTLMTNLLPTRYDDMASLIISEMMNEFIFQFGSKKASPVLANYLPKLFEVEPRLKDHLDNSESPFYNLSQLQLDLAKSMAAVYCEVITRDLSEVNFAALHFMFGNDRSGACVIRVALYLIYVLNGTIHHRYLAYRNVPPNQISTKGLKLLLNTTLKQYSGLEEKIVSVAFESLATSRSTFDQFRSYLQQRFSKVVISPDPIHFRSTINLMRNIRVAFKDDSNPPSFVKKFIDDITLLNDYTYNNDHRIELSRRMRHPLDCHILRDELVFYLDFFLSGNIDLPPHKNQWQIDQDFERIFKLFTTFDSILLIYIFAEWIGGFDSIEKSIKKQLNHIASSVFEVSVLMNLITSDAKRLQTFDYIWRRAKSVFFKLKDHIEFESDLTPNNLDKTYPESKRVPFKLISNQLADLCQKHTEATYGDISKLAFLNLLSSPNSKFTILNRKNQDSLMDNLTERGRNFDMKRLKTELCKIYGENHFGAESIYKLYMLMVQEGLVNRFLEVTKLATLALTVAPALCEVSCGDVESQLNQFQWTLNDFDEKCSNEWVFVVLNRAITEQLHPRHAESMSTTEKSLMKQFEMRCLAIGDYGSKYQCPVVSPDRVECFRDATTEEVCHRYCQSCGLETLLYHREINQEINVDDIQVEELQKSNQTVDEHCNIFAYHAGLLALLAYQNSSLKTNGLVTYLPKLLERKPRLKDPMTDPKSPFHNLSQLQIDLAKSMAEVYREVINRDLSEVNFASLQFGFDNDRNGARAIRVALWLNYVLDGTIHSRYLAFRSIPHNHITAKRLVSLLDKTLEQYSPSLQEKIVSVTVESLPTSRFTFDKLRRSLQQRFSQVVMAPDPIYRSVINLMHNFRMAFEYHFNPPPFVKQFLGNITLLYEYISYNEDKLKASRVMRHPLDCYILREELEIYHTFFRSGEVDLPSNKDQNQVDQDFKHILEVFTTFDSILLIHIFSEWVHAFEAFEKSIMKDLNYIAMCAYDIHTMNDMITSDTSLLFERIWGYVKTRFFEIKEKFNFDCNLTRDNLNQAYPASKRASFRLIFDQLAKLVQKHIEAIYGDMEKLEFLNLLSPNSKPNTVNGKRRNILVDSVVERNRNFDKNCLQAELGRLYDAKHFGTGSIYELYQLLIQKGFVTRFPEVTMLASLALTTAPSLCGVSPADIETQLKQFQWTSNEFDGVSSDEWMFVVLNRAITEQLHPRIAEDKIKEKLPFIIDADNAAQYQNSVVSLELVDCFCDATTEEVCQRYFQSRGLDTSLPPNQSN